MEFDLLLDTERKTSSFAHYSITNIVHPNQNNVKYTGFYYIGKNPENIEKIVKVFKRGYACENIENAKSELTRCLSREKNIVPEVILCESHFEIAALQSLCQYLDKHHIFASIPFLIVSGNFSESKINHLRKHNLADDIIDSLEIESGEIVSKVEFIKKFKSKTGKSSGNPIQDDHFFNQVEPNLLLKRIFDVVVSAGLIILLSPLFFLIALAIVIESRGPVFYISQRAGRGYRIFNFFKFRTMYSGADKTIIDYSHLNQYKDENKGPVFFKLNNDPRVTRIGSFLRNSSLDELPQLINVLLGNMSLVGNRPLPTL